MTEESPYPYGVLAVYAAVALWGIIAFRDFKQYNKGRGTMVCGILLAVVLNVRYLIDGQARGIAFFVALYDVMYNLFLKEASETPQAMSPCFGNEQASNNCSAWPPTYYAIHPKWAVAFYHRFQNPNLRRSTLLTGHLVCNTIVFVLMHYQIFFSPPSSSGLRHRILGYVSLAFLIIGVGCAVLLASEHGPVSEYGGNLSKYGFYFMSLCVCLPAVMGIRSKRQGCSREAHRIWMIRFAGSMWGSFWIFRLMLFLTGPLLRNFDTVAPVISAWFSAPIGIAIAEVLRVRRDKQQLKQNETAVNATATKGGKRHTE